MLVEFCKVVLKEMMQLLISLNKLKLVSFSKPSPELLFLPAVKLHREISQLIIVKKKSLRNNLHLVEFPKPAHQEGELPRNASTKEEVGLSKKAFCRGSASHSENTQAVT